MGNFLVKLFKRLFDFPIKRKPICYYRQEDFSCTGEPLFNKSSTQGLCTYLDQFQTKFYSKLLELRQAQKKLEKSGGAQAKTEDNLFPGWNEMTTTNLHTLFLLFNNSQNGMLNFTNFTAILESFGDENTFDYKRHKFEEADLDKDGWISYDEFISLLYYMNPPLENGELNGIARLCAKMAENIKFITSLSVGEQLEYGLF